ncbi:IST1-like protein [Quillaja saponaria]|uniref:IST1-like protein n=1 Tax=Quillaja saponaria TaxID=32244 RepID=A0AAD7P5X7_QUISA|nr:IST1-like protein [Quillaja saponaria]
MGKKLDALFGRSFKIAKFKPLVNLAISRLAILKNQRQVRWKQARSDAVQLLQLGHHERALLRVELVIKEQNMLDVYVLIEGYCNLLIERVHLLEQERECPEELKEGIAGLLYAASRCGDFPELQEIRAILTSRFGKEFAAAAIELRNNCGVNPKMIQKLSTRMPSLENRMKALKEIASENNIVLQLEESSSVSTKEEMNVNKQNQPISDSEVEDNLDIFPETGRNYHFSDSFKTRQKYKDVADAAQAAFESAAYAAAAARAAVELSRSEPRDPDDQNSPNARPTRIPDRHGMTRLMSQTEDKETRIEKQVDLKLRNSLEVGKEKSASNSTSAEQISKETMVPTDAFGEDDPFEKELVFDDSDNETYINHNSTKSQEQISSRHLSGLKAGPGHTNPISHAGAESDLQSRQQLDLQKRPISVRTRQVRGY